MSVSSSELQAPRGCLLENQHSRRTSQPRVMKLQGSKRRAAFHLSVGRTQVAQMRLGAARVGDMLYLVLRERQTRRRDKPATPVLYPLSPVSLFLDRRSFCSSLRAPSASGMSPAQDKQRMHIRFRDFVLRKRVLQYNMLNLTCRLAGKMFEKLALVMRLNYTTLCCI